LAAGRRAVTDHNGPAIPADPVHAVHAGHAADAGNSGDPGDESSAPRPTHRVRHFAPDDDLLSGFDRAGRPVGLRAFFATTIGASLLVWDQTFSLGAYHTVFYYRLFQILVASTVLLIGALVLRRDVKVRPWMLILLAIPLLWMISRVVAPFGRGSDANHVVDLALIGLTLASVPFTLWAVARILSPDYFELPARRLKTAAVAIIVLVGLTGFLVGQFNYDFTTCHDYVIAGDDEPSNCHTEPTTRPPSTTPTTSPSTSPAPSKSQ
jgi:hypothetical protein